MTDEMVTMAHGAGGRKMNSFIHDLIKKYFSNPILDRMDDGAVLGKISGHIVVTTDSFVVHPLFFPGGDIGRLAVCGTVNDLTAMGACPLYLTVGLILEEGLALADLEKVLKSMQTSAAEAGVTIVAGDTKVVEKGQADKLFINTTGIGEIVAEQPTIGAAKAQPGDVIILTGTLGDHEITILQQRQGMEFSANIQSDCAPLNGLIQPLLDQKLAIHVMRDPTRGGLAAVLNEIAEASQVKLLVDEASIPANPIVTSVSSIFGFDPLYLANEGKMLVICAEKDQAQALKLLRGGKYGKKAAIIGQVAAMGRSPQVILSTKSGGERLLLMPEGELLPRIC